ncbi:MAG: glutamate-5-semialdehyde dehydrogenase [Oscillospiraceae bacterium]|nr:glutamate-5-semialdehyde dehydrogenase [Oscillospiraceae bacterium]
MEEKALTAIEIQGAAAKLAAAVLRTSSTSIRNDALVRIAAAILEKKQQILDANAIDMKEAQESGMTPALLDRLLLNSDRIDSIAHSVTDVVRLADPIGQVEQMETRPNGLIIGKRTVPLGVIGMIYEARPNVTVDAAVLCLKSANAVILRGGKEAFNSNNAFVDIMREAIAQAGLPEDSIAHVQDTSRDSVDHLLNGTAFIDVLIPRGGAGLINHVVANAKVPIIETGIGVCHVYVESTADLDMAEKIIYNAKCRRPSVCNAAETLLVDRSIADKFLPMAKRVLDQNNTELRGCPETQKILGDSVIPVTEEDYYAEFLDYVLAVKVVDGFDEAVSHIAKYGSAHSDAIVTSDYAMSNRFLDVVDSAAVYVNASTAFTDGGEFGLGAEIGISTQKMHARGPMGLKELTSTKFIIYGEGQVR